MADIKRGPPPPLENDTTTASNMEDSEWNFRPEMEYRN